MKQKVIVGIVLVAIILAIVVYMLYPVSDVSQSMEMEDETTASMEQEKSYTDVSPEEAKALIDNNPDLIIIDVSPFYEDGHIPGAINYYVGGGELDAAINAGELDPNAMYLVYCHFASASRLGAQKLIDAGFTNVYRIDGEFGAWRDAGYEIEM